MSLVQSEFALTKYHWLGELIVFFHCLADGLYNSLIRINCTSSLFSLAYLSLLPCNPCPLGLYIHLLLSNPTCTIDVAISFSIVQFPTLIPV